MTRRTLTERRETVQAVPVEGAGQGRFRVQLITPGWGSSGYYSADLLEKAAKDKRFPAGLHMNIDHPTESQERERPEGSIRDLAATLASDAEWDGTALVGEATVFGPYRQVLDEMKDAIGISIRAAAEVTEGEAEGRHGVIISDIVEGYSADFITHAGRGGRIVEVLEAARLREATANDRREQIGNAVRDAYSSADQFVFVRDFDEDAGTVWFEAMSREEGGDHTWQQAYAVADDDLSVTLTGTRTEVRPVTQYVPVSPAGPTTTEEHDMPQIEESRLRELEEASGRVETLESERDTAQRERDDARRDLATERATTTARTRARSRVTEANANLHSSVVDRIVESATREVPLTDAGQLDEQTFDTRVDEARTAEESYLNGLAEASGAGTVRGFGGSTTTSTVEEAEQVREASDKARASAFGRKPQTQEA